MVSSAFEKSFFLTRTLFSHILVEMFHAAKEWLDANTNMVVVGGFLSPSHDRYVNGKLGNEYIPAVHRFLLSISLNYY